MRNFKNPNSQNISIKNVCIMKESEDKIIYTIGHSTREFEEFLAMLKNNNIKCLVDVRRFPSSKKFPAYNQDSLRATLSENDIEYIHIEALGGRRKALKDSPNSVWNHPSFRGYADYMETSEFCGAVKVLEKIASTKVTAIMCSEAVFWRCHRSMISDFLKSEKYQVFHIMSTTKFTEHPYTAPAHIENGKLTYHEESTEN